MSKRRSTPLSTARIERLLTKAALAERAGVHRGTIDRAERGQPISDVNQERIARALGVSREDLFPEPETVEATA